MHAMAFSLKAFYAVVRGCGMAFGVRHDGYLEASPVIYG